MRMHVLKMARMAAVAALVICGGAGIAHAQSLFNRSGTAGSAAPLFLNGNRGEGARPAQSPYLFSKKSDEASTAELEKLHQAYMDSKRQRKEEKATALMNIQSGKMQEVAQNTERLENYFKQRDQERIAQHESLIKASLQAQTGVAPAAAQGGASPAVVTRPVVYDKAKQTGHRPIFGFSQ